MSTIKKRSTGRKTKYTAEVREKFREALSIGASRDVACKYAGINISTFYQWMATKEDFSELVKSAESHGVVTWLQVVEDAAKQGQWQAAAWKLERLYPERYGRRAIINGNVTIASKAYMIVSPDDWDAAHDGQPPALPDPTIIDADAVDAEPGA